MPERPGVTTRLVTLAVPCRTDEPALGRTLAEAWASWQAGPAAVHALELLVCLNGEPGDGRALRDLRAFAAAHGVEAALIDLEAGGTAAHLPVDRGLVVAALCMRRAGKALAWNVLRGRARAPAMLFMDADVSLGPGAFGLLLDALADHPQAVLASARTTCAARPTWFEAVMAAPYAIDFPNLSPQLYAARTEVLPATMPDDLLEPERWLELTVGADRIVRPPGARVVVRLPATLRDFWRQRVRIEMAKVQLAAEHPHLAGRGAVQPGIAAVLRRLGPADLARLGIYLALRESAHAVAKRWYARGRSGDVWRQSGSTKRWGPS
jgi:hypothetical protein